MNIQEIREKIDNIDNDLCDLFSERMDLALAMAKYKKENGLAVLDQSRENQVLHRITDRLGEPLDKYGRILFNTMFDVSRAYQHSCMESNSELRERIRKALEDTPQLFPEKATVACQGIEGAFSQAAAEKLFAFPTIMFFSGFESVFNAVEKGLCKYGLLPIENSSYGSVGRVYDLMKSHKFNIARVVRMKISHKLLASPKAKLEDITEIISHEQAIGQCADFIQQLGETRDLKITICENTALAAERVAKSGRTDIAAISSRECAGIYGLQILSENIQISDNNYTRFICISKDLEIYPGASKISLMLTLPHRPMSLYRMLARFSAMGLNLTKLESRNIPGSDFEFMFYFDIEASVLQEEVLDLLCELDLSPETFVFLGNYVEL
ncbi:MAG: bifunctional chorismate mutase/prephenate dehydratase [Firmicutes bacterium]|nr:bifunctional chorismate mutase/prephenate dehydratase [Bacillota bacterium]